MHARTDMRKLTVASRNFANAPKNFKKNEHSFEGPTGSLYQMDDKGQHALDVSKSSLSGQTTCFLKFS
jgi:hypothetical protein